MPLCPSQELARGGACFEDMTSFTIKWATVDLPEECRFLLNTQLMFLKEKDPTSKQFDEDKWIRSLTDIPENSVSCDQQDVDPKKVRPHLGGRVLAEIRFAATRGTQ